MSEPKSDDGHADESTTVSQATKNCAFGDMVKDIEGLVSHDVLEAVLESTPGLKEQLEVASASRFPDLESGEPAEARSIRLSRPWKNERMFYASFNPKVRPSHGAIELGPH